MFLLKRGADSPALASGYERRDSSGTVYLRFSYQVVRVWQLPVETLLTGGLATLPLAPIADVAQEQLPQVIARMRERIESETAAARQAFWTATYFLMGTKWSDGLIDELLKGMATMFESTTYTATIEKGRAQGLSQGLSQGELRGRGDLVLTLGRERLGDPPAEVSAFLSGITDPELFGSLIKRVAVATAWSELLP